MAALRTTTQQKQSKKLEQQTEETALKGESGAQSRLNTCFSVAASRSTMIKSYKTAIFLFWKKLGGLQEEPTLLGRATQLKAHPNLRQSEGRAAGQE